MKLFADAQGVILAVHPDLSEREPLDEWPETVDGAVETLVIDPDTNPALVGLIWQHWRDARLSGGVLSYHGEPVTVNPPGSVWQTREDFHKLHGWATWTGQQASDYNRGAVLNGMNKAEVEAWVDQNITGTTVTQLRTQTKAALKQIGGELIDLREIAQKLAQAIMYLRDMQQ